jgi:hypothetical protein
MAHSFALQRTGAFTSLAQGQLAAAKATLYTAAGQVSVCNITLAVTDVAAHTVNIYLKRSGGTSRRLIPKDLPMDGDDYNKAAQVECLEETLSLSSGDLIEGDADSANLIDYSITGTTR